MVTLHLVEARFCQASQKCHYFLCCHLQICRCYLLTLYWVWLHFRPLFGEPQELFGVSVSHFKGPKFQLVWLLCCRSGSPRRLRVVRKMDFSPLNHHYLEANFPIGQLCLELLIF
jgi:hypothetical protein